MIVTTEQNLHLARITEFDAIEIANRLGITKDIKRVDIAWLERVYQLLKDVDARANKYADYESFKEWHDSVKHLGVGYSDSLTFRKFLDSIASSNQKYAYIYSFGLSNKVDIQTEQGLIDVIISSTFIYSESYSNLCFRILRSVFAGKLFNIKLENADANS